MNIRPTIKADLPALEEVIDSSELFPSEYLESMITPYLQGEAQQEIWLTTELEDQIIAICYCAPERMTEGTYNLYLIAVRKEAQGKGVGRKIMAHVEQLLQQQGVRVLLVETSGLAEFELTREFYDKCQYYREAVIRDFYQEGEDKVVFWKKL